MLLASSSLQATTQQAAGQSSAPQANIHKTSRAHKRPSTATQPTPPQPQSVVETPPAPKPPDWPANDHPADASVVWNSQGLRIDASNSSLSQILKDVSTATGTKVEGLGADQRVFGTFGPGTARDVLAKLLEGSGYNVLMIGDQGQGTPRQLLLSAQTKGGAPQLSNDQSQNNDENADAGEQQPQEPQPQPQPPPNMRNGFGPGAPPRTPQQIMQEMQQRQMQQNGVPPQ